jgi:hypothetical protein
VKTCVQCQGKLGLGIRARNLWNGRWWSHVYFCSARCEDCNELERSEANAKPRWRSFYCSRLALTFDACGLDRKSIDGQK